MAGAPCLLLAPLGPVRAPALSIGMGLTPGWPRPTQADAGVHSTCPLHAQAASCKDSARNTNLHTYGCEHCEHIHTHIRAHIFTHTRVDTPVCRLWSQAATAQILGPALTG